MHTFGQIKSGRVIYERKINLEKKFARDSWADWIIKEIGKIKYDRFELWFNDTSSAYLPLEEENDDRFNWVSEKSSVWQNFNNNKLYAKRNFYGDDVFITDSLHKRIWKITDETRKIAGFNCRMAVWQPDSVFKMYAWFAPDLITSSGPESYSGLPGVILGLAKEDGSVQFFAQKVEIVNAPVDKLQHPTRKVKYRKAEEVKQDLSGTSRDKYAKEFLINNFKYW